MSVSEDNGDRTTLEQELGEDTLAALARHDAIRDIQEMDDDDVEATFALGEEGAFGVESMLDVRNTTADYGIVGVHERGCGCKNTPTGRRWDPECRPGSRLAS